MEDRVVVTYQPDEEEREMYQKCLGDLAQVTSLENLRDRGWRKAMGEANVIISRSFSPEEIPQGDILCMTRATFIQLIFSGADNVPFALIPEQATVATNSGAFAEPIAEHVLAMTLSLAKSLCQKHDLLARGEFDQSGLNRQLNGQVCGIIGFGGNGKAVAKIMSAIGMRVYGINRSGITDGPVDFIGAVDDLKKVLEESDVVVLTLPLTRETMDVIGHKQLEWMKRDAILINVARGGVVNQKALYAHMRANPDFRVGIDTWWSEPSSHGVFTLQYPFFDLPNLIASPHIADHVPGMMSRATKRALENVRNYLLGKPVRGVVKRSDYVG